MNLYVFYIKSFIFILYLYIFYIKGVKVKSNLVSG